MSLTLSEVEHIASLARLKLTAEELEKYCLQLSAILDYVDRLKELDTESILPTSSVLPDRNVARPDVPLTSLLPDVLLENAPDTQKNQFKVPPVRE